MITQRVRCATPARAPTLAKPTFAVSVLECSDHEIGAECRYQVAWSINPHMAIGAVDFVRAAAQHAQLVHVLEGAGAAIERLPFVHGAFDSVFVKDPALLLVRDGRRRALLARFRHRERHRERTARARHLEQRGYEIVGDDRGPVWEGGDVIMLPSGEGMFLGHGVRSDRGAAAWLERHAGLPVWPLELRTPQLYHLDMALAILPDGTALVCPWALTAESLRLLRGVHGAARVRPVEHDLALEFGLNLVMIGDTIIIGSTGPRSRRVGAIVTALGYRTVTVPLDEFHLAGGSAACLVTAVHRDLEH